MTGNRSDQAAAPGPRLAEESALAIARASLAATGFVPTQIERQLGAERVAQLEAELAADRLPSPPASATTTEEG